MRTDACESKQPQRRQQTAASLSASPASSLPRPPSSPPALAASRREQPLLAALAALCAVVDSVPSNPRGISPPRSIARLTAHPPRLQPVLVSSRPIHDSARRSFDTYLATSSVPQLYSLLHEPTSHVAPSEHDEHRAVHCTTISTRTTITASATTPYAAVRLQPCSDGPSGRRATKREWTDGVSADHAHALDEPSSSSSAPQPTTSAGPSNAGRKCWHGS